MREVYLSRGVVIEPDVAAEAGVPDGMGVAFFTMNVQRGGLSTKKEQYEMSVNLVNGLAVRLGGIAWPEASVMREPLRATIYTAREDVTADQVYAIAAGYAQGLASYDDVTLGSINVSTWRTRDRRFEAEFWPRGKVVMMLADTPRSIGDLFYHPDQTTVTVLQLATPGNETDPSTARLLGECALEVAAAAGGVCTDQFGFRVARPDDLVFR
jgi:hypothetical protein